MNGDQKERLSKQQTIEDSNIHSQCHNDVVTHNGEFLWGEKKLEEEKDWPGLYVTDSLKNQNSSRKTESYFRTINIEISRKR